MANYVASANAGTANSTAATAGLGAINQGANLSSIRLYTFEIGPQANSADNTYGCSLNRDQTVGTWTTAITPAPLDSTHQSACNAVANAASTAAGGTPSTLFNFGFHMRAGYRWVAIPGGEVQVGITASYGVFVRYLFCQGTDVNSIAMWFSE